jgi:hypothetical protein
LEATIIGRVRRREVIVNRVARWDNVWHTCEVWAWVGGSKSGRGPRRSADDRGPWVRI